MWRRTVPYLLGANWGSYGCLIAILSDDNVIAAYPTAVLTRFKNKGSVGEVQAFVLSQEGKNLLQQRGFLP